MSKGYFVMYVNEDGEKSTSHVVHRFDSLSELSAKTIARMLADDGCTDIYICECEYTPIYRITSGEMVKVT